MEFSLINLGTASAKPSVDKYPSAHVFNMRGRLFLVDCGEGAQVQMMRYGLSSFKMDHILISHMHGDHVFGIFGLLSTMGMLGRTAPLTIYAPRDFGSMLNFFLGHFGEGIKYEISHVVLGATSPELICETRTADVYAFPLNHGIPTFGFIFREKWKTSPLAPYPRYCRSAAYCSDTAWFPQLAEWVRGVDLLYHEATYTEDMREQAVERFHSTAAQAAQVAREAGVGRLIVGHFSSRYKNADALLAEARAIFPETYAAQEGARFLVPLKKFTDTTVSK